MKQHHYLILIILLASGQASLSQDLTPSNLHGSWTLNYSTTLASLDPTGQAQYDAQSAESQAYLQSTMEGLTVTFSSNGSYQLQTSEGEEITGTWQWGTDQALHVTINEQTQTQHVHGLSPTDLTLGVADPDNSKIIFHTWYLEK